MASKKNIKASWPIAGLMCDYLKSPILGLFGCPTGEWDNAAMVILNNYCTTTSFVPTR